MKDGGQAYPVTPTDRAGQCAPTQLGMTMRQWYKGMAMHAVTDQFFKRVCELAGGDLDIITTSIAHTSSLFADAMIAEDTQHEESKNEES